MPSSAMAATTSGWTRSPGSVPAETARAFVLSVIELKNAAAICERPALWTQAKMTVFTTWIATAERRHSSGGEG